MSFQDLDDMSAEHRKAVGNVSQLRKNREALKPRAQALLAVIEPAANIKPDLSNKYLIKGWLYRSGVSVLYGPSNTGKSFLALDMAHHVAKGLDWGGKRVRKGRVLYVAAEGGAAFSNRVAALEDPEFWVLNNAFTLAGADSQAAPLAETIQHLSAVGGAPFDLIIFDTLSRVMGNLDENAAPAIAELVRGVDLLRRATGAHVMLVHHTGKEAAKGARGHSALRAAIDTEIELSRDDIGEITAQLTKQRDAPTGAQFSFRLNLFRLGHDEDGDMVTTCTVQPHQQANERKD